MTTIMASAFRGNSLITSVIVPEGYTSLGSGAFRECTALKSVSLPSTLISAIGTRQFRDCTSLEYVNIPAGITNINGEAFYGCTNPNLVIDIQGVSVTIIGSKAFTNVTGTIKTYSQDVYNLVNKNATTANVILINNKFENLQKAIDESKTYVNNQGYYTSDSYAVLSEALAVGNSLLENENATTEEITTATTAINNAISGLTYKGFTEFDKVLAQAEDLVQNHKYEYTYESWSRLSSWTVQAKEYKESVTGEITEYIQMQINSHEENMLSGINGLVALDKTEVFNELVQTIETAESYEKEDFTDESFAVLQTAIGTAKLVADNAEKAVIDEAREALSKAIEGLTTEPIIVTGTVSGTIKVSDSDDSTEMTVTAVSSDGTETTVTATSIGTYTIENLEAGDYTLTVSGGKYTDRSYEITVTEGENTQDVELNPYGDINGDGKITTADVGMANSHAKGVITLTDYGFACADVKTDGSITTADVGMINSHAKS